MACVPRLIGEGFEPKLSLGAMSDSSARTALDPESLQIQVYPTPEGLPQSYGPPVVAPPVEDVNPFWSERIRDDVALRALRPTSLPVVSDNGCSGNLGSNAAPLDGGCRGCGVPSMEIPLLG